MIYILSWPRVSVAFNSPEDAKEDVSVSKQYAGLSGAESPVAKHEHERLLVVKTDLSWCVVKGAEQQSLRQLEWAAGR